MNLLLTLSTPARRAECGFTLIELLVTIGVAAILSAIAIPAFNNFVQDDRDTTQINSLVSSLNYARSEAVKRNTSFGVQVCPSSDELTCNAPAAGWGAGWIVLDMDPAVLTPANVLQAIPALSGPNVLTATGGGANGVTFKSNGGVVAGGNVSVKVCDLRGSAYARDAEVSLVGSIASSQNHGQDAKGTALACP